MERAATVMKTLHGGVSQKSSPTTRGNRSDASFSPRYNPITPDGNKPRCRYSEDYSATELSIFDAHKYFNGEAAVTDNVQKVTPAAAATTSRVSPLANNMVDVAESGGAKGAGATARYSPAGGGFIINGSATPSAASSEASWNSQACLLAHSSNAARAAPESKSKNPTDLNYKKLKLWLLRRKCPCTGRKSVRVKEPSKAQPIPTPKPVRDHSSPIHEDGDKTPQITPRDNTVIAPNTDWDVDRVPMAAKSQRFNPHRIVASSASSLRLQFSDAFTFPVLNPHAPPPPTANGALLREEEEEDRPPRDSLEVFQPPDHHDALVLQPAPDDSPGGGDDAASDASSDLFEIESFSTAAQSACPAAFRRRSVDEGSTECYEPSEASVVWSVTTAEGCYEESEECGGGGGGGGGGEAGAEKWRRKGGTTTGNGLLVGCRGEKAVSVGPQPVRKIGGGAGTGEGQRGATCCASRHVNMNCSRVGGGGAVGIGIGIGIGIGLGSVNKPPLPLARPHGNNNNTAPRMSLAFAT